MAENTCRICFGNYVTTGMIPRVLPCGHIFCTFCIDKLHSTSTSADTDSDSDSNDASNGHVPSSSSCPACGQSFTGAGAAQPVSGQVVHWLSSLTLASDELGCKNTRKTATNFSADLYLQNLSAGGLEEALKEKESDISSLLDDTMEVLLAVNNSSAALKNRIKTLKRQQRKVQHGISAVRSHERELDHPLTAVDVASAVERMSACAQLQEQLLEDWKEKPLDHEENIMQTDEVRKMLSGTRGCYAVFRYPRASKRPSLSGEDDQNNFVAPPAAAAPAAAAAAPGERAAVAVTSSSPSTNSAAALVEEQEGSDTDSDNNKEEEEEEECHYAKLTIDGKYLLLHSLKHEKVRPSDLVEELVHSDLVRTVSPDGLVVFLDLSRSLQLLGRVYLQLEGDTPWSRHFMALCAGQSRTSLVGTKLVGKGLGKASERMDAVLPGSMQCRHSAIVDNSRGPHSNQQDIEAGLLAASPSGFHEVLVSSVFMIYTRPCPGYTAEMSFGRVVGGLALLQGGVSNTVPLIIRNSGILLNTIS